MKNILDILQEMEGCSTPGDTMGIGNPLPAEEGSLGSEPICAKCKKEKPKKKKIRESLLDADLEDTVLGKLVKEWLVKYAHWDPKFIDSEWDIDGDGSLSLRNKSTERYVVFTLADPAPFPGKWEKDSLYKFQIDVRDDLDWKKLNLPDSVGELEMNVVGDINVDLSGLTFVASRGRGLYMSLNSKALPTIKFDPKLKITNLTIHDGVWNNEDLGNLKIAFPKGVKTVTIPKSMAAGMLSKQMKTDISIN